MADKETKLSLIIRAVDEATGPLKKINEQLQKQNAPFKEFGKQLKTFGEESGLKRLGEAFKGVGTAAANVGKEAFVLGAKLAAIATGAGYAFYTVIRGAVDAGDKLNEMAKRVGLSVDAYAQLQFAAAQADVPQEEFNSSLDQFNKRLGEVKAHSGPIYTFLGKVGPGLLKQVEAAKSTEEAFGLMVQAMEAIPDPARRAALSAELFGRGGLQMGQFLGQGTAAIEEQKKRFLELSGSQEKFAKGADALDNAMRETETAFLGVRNSVAAELFPALTELAKVVTGLVSENREGLAQWAKETGKSISDWVKDGGVQKLIQGFKDFKAAIMPMFNAIGGLKGLFVGVGLIMAGPLIGSVLSLLGAFGNLGLALLTLNPVALIFIGTAAAVGAAALTIYKNWEPLKQLFSEIWDTFKQVTTAFVNFDIKGGFKTIGKALGFESAYGNAYHPELKANPALASGSAGSGQSRVTVDFNNVPRGVSVTPARGGTAELNLSVGKAMSQ